MTEYLDCLFFLTIDAPIKVARICLNVAKLFTYKSFCFLTSSLISLLKVLNFDLSFLLPAFFCFSMILLLLGSFRLISEIFQGIEKTIRLVLDGMCLSADS